MTPGSGDATRGVAHAAQLTRSWQGFPVPPSVECVFDTEECSVNDLIDTTEMYLRTIFELEEEGIVPLRARIAERLHQSGPTVSQTVARMERDGLLRVEGDRHLQLSDEGRTLATAVMRKHRLAECLLVDVIGLDYADVHEEACRWEHVMSDRVEKRLAELLGHPHFSPYGNPIPGLSELGEEPTHEDFLQGVVPLLDVARPAQGTTEVIRADVKRLGEPLQPDVELLARLAEAGIVPGTTVEAQWDGGMLSVRGGDAEKPLALADDVTRHVFVAAG
jgi:DtxR family Mn-dependent transcriptional regulator